MKEKFYITTAIFYASQKPHIGNTYEVVMADAIARYKRMRGYDVYFLTGTDEHGLKIQEAAEKAGVEPQRFVDGVTGELKQIWDKFGISYDGFIRTTDEQHCKAVQKIFKKLYEQGDIYKGTYEGWYCTPDESFWTPAQLVDGKCPECGREVIKANEDAYFLKLTKYQERLAHILTSIRTLSSLIHVKTKWSTTSLNPVCRICVFHVLHSNGAYRSILTTDTLFTYG